MENFGRGAMPPKVDKRDYKLAAAAVSSSFPEEFELEMGEVKNQGNVSSCVAHSATEIVEYFNKKQENITDKMSVGFIYGKRYVFKGKGMYLRDALKTLKNIGVCDEKQFPYNKEVPEIIELFNDAVVNIEGEEENKISTYFSIKGEDEIKSTLMNYGPVMISIRWYDNIKVKDGIITTDKKGDYGYHCIVIYGWNKDGWKIMNSWGKGWGNKGFAILPYDYKLQESWGISDEILREGEDIVVPKRNWFLDIIYKIVNFFLNLFKKK